MTLNALLASAESAFGARLSQSSSERAHTHTALTAAPVMNANHFSFSVSVDALNRHDYIGNSMSCAVPVIQRSFACGCES